MGGRASLEGVNTTPVQPEKLPGFKVVPRRSLDEVFNPSQSAYYILIGRGGTSEDPRERVLFVQYLDRFLDSCHQQIEELWRKHRVLITHVAVKVGRRLRPERELAKVYDRAVTVHQLREKLQPRFRRL
jgi:hypothetical protein